MILVRPLHLQVLMLSSRNQTVFIRWWFDWNARLKVNGEKILGVTKMQDQKQMDQKVEREN